jgi:hypothetical protein
MLIIKTYEEFAPKPKVTEIGKMKLVDTADMSSGQKILLLPPHSSSNDDEKESSKKVFFLDTLYEMSNNNIIATANKINDICKSNGFYINIKHLKTKLNIITGNEPNIIFGAEAGSTINIGGHNGIPVEEDSIIINQKGDDSLYIFSIKDNYQITFIKPKIIISEHDPYGEEDWDEHEHE